MTDPAAQPSRATAARNIEDFLAQKRIAFVGVSRQPREFSRTLFREFVAQGYDMIPVNPRSDAMDERPCFPAVSKINPPVDAAFILTAPRDVNAIVGDCLLAGVPRIWIHLSSKKDSLNRDLVRRCQDSGVALIQGFCPYMFLPGSSFPHRLHAWFVKRSPAYRK